MEVDDKKEIILDSIYIVENFVNPYKSSESGLKYCESAGLCFFIEDYENSYNRLYGKILAKLKKNHHIPDDAFSKEYVSEFIDKLIAEIIKNINDVKENFLSVDFFHEYFHEHEVIIFLEDFKFSYDKPLKIGKVTLSKIDHKILDAWSKDRLFNLINNDKRMGEIYGKTYATIKVFGSDKIGNGAISIKEDFALAYAENELEKVLDIINYSIPRLYPNKRIFVGLESPVTEITYYSTFILDPDYKFSSAITGLRGDDFKFEINEKTIKIMEKIGIFKISSILEKFENSITPFESTILSGIHWYANSLTQPDIENEFLSLMICLEILLTPTESEPINTSIAEAVAIILSPSEKRFYCFTKIKEFYNKRSIIVHGRKVNGKNKFKLHKNDANDLRKILGKLIEWMVNYKDSFESKKELLQLINSYKISGGTFSPKTVIRSIKLEKVVK